MLGDPTMKMEKILFGSDYSESSKRALEFATSLARDTGACLIIAHVSDREPYPVGERFDDQPDEDPAEMQDLKKIVPKDPEVPYKHRVLYAEPGSPNTVDPATELVKFADREAVDAIVLGTHGRSGLAHLLMGSVAESVVRQANCPVVTVKQTPIAS